MPCAIATLATDVPGAAHSARICAFSSVPYRLRLRLFSVPIVSSYSLTGQDRYRQPTTAQDGFAGRLPFGFGQACPKAAIAVIDRALDQGPRCAREPPAAGAHPAGGARQRNLQYVVRTCARR